MNLYQIHQVGTGSVGNQVKAQSAHHAVIAAFPDSLTTECTEASPTRHTFEVTFSDPRRADVTVVVTHA